MSFVSVNVPVFPRGNDRVLGGVPKWRMRKSETLPPTGTRHFFWLARELKSHSSGVAREPRGTATQ